MPPSSSDPAAAASHPFPPRLSAAVRRLLPYELLAALALALLVLLSLEMVPLAGMMTAQRARAAGGGGWGMRAGGGGGGGGDGDSSGVEGGVSDAGACVAVAWRGDVICGVVAERHAQSRTWVVLTGRHIVWYPHSLHRLPPALHLTHTHTQAFWRRSAGWCAGWRVP